jgi:hypothetical protein
MESRMKNAPNPDRRLEFCFPKPRAAVQTANRSICRAPSGFYNFPVAFHAISNCPPTAIQKRGRKALKIVAHNSKSIGYEAVGKSNSKKISRLMGGQFAGAISYQNSKLTRGAK